MSDDADNGHRLRLQAWMNGLHNASMNYATGVDGAVRAISTAVEQDAARTAEIDYLEALWALEGPSGD